MAACHSGSKDARLWPVTPSPIVRVGVLGAGAWARGAHLPGYRRDPRCRDRRHRRHRDRSRARRRRGSSTSPRRPPTRASCSTATTSTSSTSARRATRTSSWPGRRSRPASTCSARSRWPTTSATRSRARDLARAEGAEDESRPDVPLQPGDALHARAGRRRLHRHAVHLQRLRAELAVARSAEPAASGGSRRRPVGPPGVVARGLRRADHRPRAPVRRQPISRRSSARCATSSPSGWSARPAA